MEGPFLVDVREAAQVILGNRMTREDPMWRSTALAKLVYLRTLRFDFRVLVLWVMVWGFDFRIHAGNAAWHDP